MRRPLSLWLLLSFLSLLGIGGLYGGSAMLVDPTGRTIQLSEMRPSLHVPDFILPGIFLLVGMGLYPLGLVCVLLTQPAWNWAQALVRPRGRYWAWAGALGLGVLLLLWLALQGVLIGFRWPIQYVTASLGFLIITTALSPKVKEFYRIVGHCADPVESARLNGPR